MKYRLDKSPTHPLRSKLDHDDWVRIQEVLDQEIPDHNATTEEIDAAHDLFFDAIAIKYQTHSGVLVLH